MGDILTRKTGLSVRMLFFRRSLEALNRGLGFINLLPQLCISNGGIALTRNNKNGEKAEYQKYHGQGPGCLFQEIGSFSDTHDLVG